MSVCVCVFLSLFFLLFFSPLSCSSGFCLSCALAAHAAAAAAAPLPAAKQAEGESGSSAGRQRCSMHCCACCYQLRGSCSGSDHY